jgi:hypothetical protein
MHNSRLIPMLGLSATGANARAGFTAARGNNINYIRTRMRAYLGEHPPLEYQTGPAGELRRIMFDRISLYPEGMTIRHV